MSETDNPSPESKLPRPVQSVFGFVPEMNLISLAFGKGKQNEPESDGIADTTNLFEGTILTESDEALHDQRAATINALDNDIRRLYNKNHRLSRGWLLASKAVVATPFVMAAVVFTPDTGIQPDVNTGWKVAIPALTALASLGGLGLFDRFSLKRRAKAESAALAGSLICDEMNIPRLPWMVKAAR